MKAAEIVIVALGIVVFIYKWEIGTYLIVFLLCLQSTLMGPAKYSIIPELVKKENIAKANSFITSFSYLAMILGSFLSSFLTHLTNRNFPLCLVVCLIAAIVGYIASTYIPKTEARKEPIPDQGMGFVQIVKTLNECKKTPKLLLAVLCSAFFLFIGAFLQLNLIPFAITSLGLDEVAGGYLFSTAAIGIALGATFAEKFCRKEVHLGLPPFALAIMGILLLIMPFFSSSLIAIALLLGGLGLMGGLYQIPLEAYMQTFSASESRGKVVAASNWLSFLGVLLAPLTLGLLGSVFSLPASASFVILAFVVIAIFIAMIRHLSVPFFNFISQYLLHPFYDLHYLGFPFGIEHQEEKIAIISKRLPLSYLSLIVGESTKIHLFIARTTPKFIDKFLSKLVAVDFLYENCIKSLDPKYMTEKILGVPSSVKPLILFPSTALLRHFETHGFFRKLEKEQNYNLQVLSLRNTTHFRPTLLNLFKRTQLVFALTPFPHIKSDVEKKRSSSTDQLFTSHIVD